MKDREALYLYRIGQAQETLFDAEKMLEENLTPRSIANRAYYSMFYALLALFIDQSMNIRTSKHSGVISFFDKEFVHTGKFEKHYSRILHTVFHMRQEGDYKELSEITRDDAGQSIEHAKTFLDAIKEFINPSLK